MTFNEGMQIDTSTASSSGGGGFGGGGLAIGGGLGGLLIVVFALTWASDPGWRGQPAAVEHQGRTPAPGFDLSQCKTGADANKYGAVPRGGDRKLRGTWCPGIQPCQIATPAPTWCCSTAQ